MKFNKLVETIFHSIVNEETKKINIEIDVADWSLIKNHLDKINDPKIKTAVQKLDNQILPHDKTGVFDIGNKSNTGFNKNNPSAFINTKNLNQPTDPNSTKQINNPVARNSAVGTQKLNNPNFKPPISIEKPRDPKDTIPKKGFEDPEKQIRMTKRLINPSGLHKYDNTKDPNNPSFKQKDGEADKQFNDRMKRAADKLAPHGEKAFSGDPNDPDNEWD